MNIRKDAMNFNEMLVAGTTVTSFFHFQMKKIFAYENCEMAIAISSSRADSANVPGVAFKCLKHGQCADWLQAFKCLDQCKCTDWSQLNV